jgi:predicted SAM-dependent methyltransferase
LRKEYPELDAVDLVNVDILADGERLESIADQSQDFVIANHFIEHCQDPIAAILNMFRVLKPTGVLYLAIPDKRNSFDSERPVTPLSHLLRDHTEGPEWSRSQHFEEWTRLVAKVTDDAEVKRRVAELARTNYSIHFHVWTPIEMMELILAIRKMTEFEVELFYEHGAEAICILRKAAVGVERN